MKRIGIVGHTDNIKRIQEVIATRFPKIEGFPIETREAGHIKNTVDFVSENINDFDGILFTGKIIFDIMNHSMHSQNPWVYLENDDSQLLRLLLEAKLKQNHDIACISIDSYSEEAVKEISEDCGMKNGELSATVANLDLFSETLISDLVNFHIKCFKKQPSSMAITGLSAVYKELQERQIPSMLLTPNSKAIENKLHDLLGKIKFQDISVSQIVVISIEIDASSEYAWTSENEYSLMLQKTKITEEVYKFAQRIQAAVVETERHYLLFTTKQIVEFETKNIRELPVLRAIQKKTNSTVSVGIGFGVTAREAKMNAVIGKNKATQMGGNQGFVVYSRKQMERITPLDHGQEDALAPTDSTIKDIAEHSGLSMNNIYQLKCLMDLYKKDTFTSQELAEELGNSLRSMNRIIERLETAGYIDVIGKKILGKSGRPSRILKLLI